MTQTTLSVDDTADIVAALKARFPHIHGPHKEDICYATTNRQEVVKKVAPMVEAMVVVGSPNSSNTQRLKEVAERAGCPRAALVQRADDIDWSVFGSIASLGITAGASAPEILVEEVIGAFAERYAVSVETVTTAEERHVLSVAAGAARDRGGGIIMAVYTDVAAEDLAAFLAGYDIGELLAYKGIAEGVENSNFLVHTSRGYFILTLYEKRVAAEDLPFFLGLMEHLHARGITCPQPVKNKHGEVLGKVAGRPAAMITFLDGMWIRRPSAGPLRGARRGAGASCISPGSIFSCSRANALSVEGWRPLYDIAAARANEVQRDLQQLLAAELAHLERAWPRQPAAGRDPCRPLSRQRVLPRRQAVRPDRLLFRLHRRARL